MQNFRSLGLIIKNRHTEDDLMVTIFYELGKNKVCQIKMFAKQKSCTIIDVEKRIFFSGVSDEQEKSYELFNI